MRSRQVSGRDETDFIAGLRALFVSAIMILAIELLCNTAHAGESALERGAYLVHGIVACGNCHTPKGPDGHALADQELSGRFMFDLPAIHAVAPNITQDNDTGIGKWTDEQIINAIRNGKRPDGTSIGPPMPVVFYRNMSDSDVLAIVAYLRSVKPINHKVEKSTFKNSLPDSYGPTIDHVADIPTGNKVASGANLASIGHCMACHTPMVNGKLDMRRVGAGGRELPAPGGGTIVSADLTPANPGGISKWTDAQVKEAITSGIRPDGRSLVRIMAFDWYKNVSPSDLDDLVTYLRTLRAEQP
jgi:mono/diheme cytochrome c family protein